jgi:chromosomal replication initiation ATPase DnaA
VRETGRNLAVLGALPLCTRIADAHGVTIEDLLGRSRSPRIVRARRELISVVHGTWALGVAETGRVFGLHHTTVMQLLKQRTREIGNA